MTSCPTKNEADSNDARAHTRWHVRLTVEASGELARFHLPADHRVAFRLSQVVMKEEIKMNRPTNDEVDSNNARVHTRRRVSLTIKALGGLVRFCLPVDRRVGFHLGWAITKKSSDDKPWQRW